MHTRGADEAMKATARSIGPREMALEIPEQKLRLSCNSRERVADKASEEAYRLFSLSQLNLATSLRSRLEKQGEKASV